MKGVRYENKPFKPPRLIKTPPNNDNTRPAEVVNKQQTPRNNCAPFSAISSTNKRSIQQLPQSIKKPDLAVKFYTITYRKRTMKKNKTWDGDGYAMEKSGGTLRFYNETGRLLGSTLLKTRTDLFELIFSCSGWEIQLDYEVSNLDEIDKIHTVLGRSVKANEAVHSSTSRVEERPSHVPISKMISTKAPLKLNLVSKKPVAIPSTSTVIQVKSEFSPIFDVSTMESPLIMNKSSDAEVNVVVDPLLTKFLRPHQRLGVKFMYDCVMGLSRSEILKDEDTRAYTLARTDEIQGCLLADEMGLGKTLMTITLIWTLLKQTPFPSSGEYSQSGVALQGICSKILIVCPVTLIGNWKREFAKWLNINRIGVLTLSNKNTPDKDRADVRNFLRVQRTYNVLIIGYEKLLSVFRELEEGKDKIGLLVCDEGHRLKNSQSKILNILTSLDIKRKVLLSGTPIQNDLNEFYTIVNFLNPGILGTISQFKKEFIVPITKSRDVNNKSNLSILSQGDEKSRELIDFTKTFILRRTNALLSKYLPPKTDLVLFCKPTDVQIGAFQKILSDGQLNFDEMTFNSSLGLITLLKKICNSPSLIKDDSYYKNKMKDQMLFSNYAKLNSGKLRVLMSLLVHIRQMTDGEKVVIVSNYTQTLNIIERLMLSEDLSFVRLDGSTPNNQRDQIVNSFNNNAKIFGFLLSAKSGGVGLNLIGASRLILFDNDWNPSIDLQAMSRIHRDGQTRPCYIYRLITTGCIDEKIFQRQLMKTSLSNKFLDESDDKIGGRSSDDLFDKTDLKDLFTVHTGTESNTHGLICSCSGLGDQLEFTDASSSCDASKNEASIISSGWTSALELKNELEHSQAESEKETSLLIRNCLVDYRHVIPKRGVDTLDHVTNAVFQDLGDEITFAFIKNG